MVTMDILYGEGDDGAFGDTLNLMTFLNDFMVGMEVKRVDLDIVSMQSVLTGIRNGFPHFDGVDKASPFKKAANLVVHYVAARPVMSRMPKNMVGEEIYKIPNHQNAIIAFHFAVEMLHNAKIDRPNGKPPAILANRIAVSRHSYGDIIQALSDLTPPKHFQLVSVLLEQLCYRVNDVSYPMIEQ